MHQGPVPCVAQVPDHAIHSRAPCNAHPRDLGATTLVETHRRRVGRAQPEIHDPARGRVRRRIEHIAHVRQLILIPHLLGGPRREDMRGARRDRRCEFTERVHLVEDPDATRVRAEHEVVLPRMNEEIVVCHERHPAAELRPGTPAIVAPEKPELGAEEEHVSIHRILAQRTRHARGRQSAVDPRECRAVVVAAIHVVREVAVPVVVGHDVRARAGVSREFDPVDPRAARQSRQARCEFGPVAAVVPTPLHIPIVRPHPEHAAPHRRLGDRAH